MNTSKQLKEFQKDLRALLKKHNATLDILLEGDTHGVFGEGIGVSFRSPEANTNGFYTWSDSKRLSNGYELDCRHLNQEDK